MALILFDIDGTLMRPMGIGRRAFDAAVLALCGRLPGGEPFPFDGMLDTQIAALTLSRLGLDPSEAEVGRLLDAYIDRLPDEAPADPASSLCPGVPGTLERASAEGHYLGLLTGNVRRGAFTKLGFVGLTDYFAGGPGAQHLLGAFGEDAFERCGLVPVALERCSRTFGRTFGRDSVWLVGDSIRDVEAARLAGVKVVAVATGFTPEGTLREARPNLFLKDLSDPDPMFSALKPEASS